MITHIVSGHAASGAIKELLNTKETKDAVIAFGDVLSIGPLEDVDTLGGQLKRGAFWQEVFEGRDASFVSTFDDAAKIERIQELYEDGKKLLFWVGPSADERLAFGRILNALDPLPETLDGVIAERTEIKTKDGLLEVEQLGSCGPATLKKLYDMRRALTQKEILAYADEWDTVSKIHSDVRFHHRRTGAYVHRNKDTFDSVILECCTNEFQPAARIIATALTKTRLDTDFLQWRLRTLIEGGTLKMQGSTNTLQDFEVKRA